MSNDFDKKNEKFFLTMDKAEIGRFYRIADCSLQNETRLRFFEMGLTNGTLVRLLKKAPSGCPLEIETRGYRLCIRKKDAKFFTIREINFKPSNKQNHAIY